VHVGANTIDRHRTVRWLSIYGDAGSRREGFTMASGSAEDQRVTRFREMAMEAVAVEAISHGFEPSLTGIWGRLGRWVPASDPAQALQEAGELLGFVESRPKKWLCDVTTFEFSGSELPETVRVEVCGTSPLDSDPTTGWLFARWDENTLRPLWLAGVVELRSAARPLSIFPAMGARWTDEYVSAMTKAQMEAQEIAFG